MPYLPSERALLYTAKIGTLNSCSKFNQIYIYTMSGNCRDFDRNVSQFILPVYKRTTQELNYFATALFVNEKLVDSKTMNWSFHQTKHINEEHPEERCYYFVISDQHECKNSSILGNRPRSFDWELYRCQVWPKVPCVQSWDYWKRDERYEPPIDIPWDFDIVKNQ